MEITFTVNQQSRTVDVAPDMPLLWVLRDVLDLKGTKFGCGVSECGACTVHINGAPRRTCTLPASAVAGADITTIEGLSPDGSHPVQIDRRGSPTDWDIDNEMENICRCATYRRIREAIHLAAESEASEPVVDAGSREGSRS